MLDDVNPEKLGIIGAIVMVICCLAPVLFVLFGIGSLSWLAGYLELAGVTVVAGVLGVTAYAVWRDRRC